MNTRTVLSDQRNGLRLFAIGALVGAIALCGAGRGHAGDDDLPLTRKGYIWDAGVWEGTFIYDETPPQTLEEAFEGVPVYEFAWGDIRHSGEAIQWSQQYTPGYGTEVFFTGGQIGQDWYALRFFTTEAIEYYERPESLSYKSERDSRPDPVDWDWVEFQYMDDQGTVQTVPVDEIYRPIWILIPNDPPEVSAARINGIDADLVLDEKPGNYTLTLDALATDAEGGVLSFTIDGDGPIEALATGAGSTRLSHTVTRTIPGQDTETPYAFTFEVTDPNDLTDTVTRTVRVANLDPVIEFFEAQGDLSIPRPLGSTIAFSADASDPGGDPLSFLWDLDGDGLFDDDTGKLASTLLDTPGAHTLGLRVEDGDGGFATRTANVTVIPEPSTMALLAAAVLATRRRTKRST